MCSRELKFPPSKNQRVEARAVSSLSGSVMLEFTAQSPSSGIEQMAVRSPAIAARILSRLRLHAEICSEDHYRLARVSEPSVSPVPEAENQEANWVVVIRWATVHSGPSVSAPIVRFYSVGTELQLIGPPTRLVPSLRPRHSRSGVGSTRSTIFRQFAVPARGSPSCRSRQSRNSLTHEIPLRT